MFNAWLRLLQARAMAVPGAWKLLTLPLFAVVWVSAKLFAGALHFVAWIGKEMASRAVNGTKKALAPLLWPAAGIALLVLAYTTLGPQGFQSILGLLLAIGLALYGLKVMVFGFSKPKKKKKKH